MERGHRPVGEQAISLMSIPLDAEILDVGCGSGWAARLMAEHASQGRVIGIDVADEMVRVAKEQSSNHKNIDYRVASAEDLPFAADTFSHAFSMESIYYYADVEKAVREIARVLKPGGLFVTVVDLYQENKPAHQWMEFLKVPVQLLSTDEYQSIFARAGLIKVENRRLIDPTPVPDDYTAGSFKSRDDLVEYRKNGSLMLSGKKPGS